MRPERKQQQRAHEQRAHVAQSLSHRSRLPVAGHSSGRPAKPVAAYRQRATNNGVNRPIFNAPEDWHEPQGSGELKIVRQPAGEGYLHAVTEEEVRARIALLPSEFTQDLEVVQFSRMTRKRRTFPCYGMQWGNTVYLYPIEESLVEAYTRPPRPAQQVEARMYGGEWREEGNLWLLHWTAESIKNFYLNNVLIHEIGHICDQRNTNPAARERYANWFAVEYGYRASKQRANEPR